MQWQRDYRTQDGSVDSEFLDAAREAGLPVAERGTDPPTLLAYEHVYMEWFERLQSSRAYTALGHPLPIPLSEITNVAVTFDLPGSVDEFVTCMQRMDQFILEGFISDGPDKSTSS